MALIAPSRSGDTHLAATTSSHSSDSHPVVSLLGKNLIEEIVAWKKCNGTQYLPKRYGVDTVQQKLGIRLAKLLLRREKSLGSKPGEVQLSLAEVRCAFSWLLNAGSFFKAPPIH